MIILGITNQSSNVQGGGERGSNGPKYPLQGGIQILAVENPKSGPAWVTVWFGPFRLALPLYVLRRGGGGGSFSPQLLPLAQSCEPPTVALPSFAARLFRNGLAQPLSVSQAPARRQGPCSPGGGRHGGGGPTRCR